MSVFESLNSISKWTTKLSLILAVASTLMIVVYVAVGVFGRLIFGVSIPGVIEISAYAFVALTLFGLPYVLTTGGHIRINFVYDHLPEKVKPYIRLTGDILSVVYLIAVIISSGHLVASSLELHATAPTTLYTPLWMPQMVLPIGFSLFLFQLLVNKAQGKPI